ncbi:hypothetical protein evm_008763 [Chilo suppressalis]|nr:hypothetical protein evm_008763 [Chilo suppressalis]
MKEVDQFYNYYSSTVQAMGSHYDRLRIKKPDEFDIFNVIVLPCEVVNSPDFEIRGKEAAFVYIILGEECRRVLKSGPNSIRNKKVLDWVDDCGYLRRSLFSDWFKSVVARALNKFKSNNSHVAVFQVDGKKYTVALSNAGPAITLNIESMDGFRMDVDFVPALKFSEKLWPPSPDYVKIPKRCRKDFWMVVPKPNKYRKEAVKARSWRVAMPQQERELMYNSYNLRQAIRLLKKLRDTKRLDLIVSYFIKQLVFMEIDARNDPSFWTQSPAIIFKVLVNKLYLAVKQHRIPYYWNKKNNLLERIDLATLKIYEHTLKNLVEILERPNDYMKVANYLLTAEELKHF